VKKDPRFTVGQAQFKFALHFEYTPELESSMDTQYRAAALMTDAHGALFLRKFLLELGGTPRQVTNVQVKEDLPLQNMHFEISVGLIDHMLVLEDVQD